VSLSRRRAAGAMAAIAATGVLPGPARGAGAAGRKVLRVAFNAAETGFDPVQISDLYSRTVTAHIFEALFRYDHLARPATIRPLTAQGMPEVSADFRTWTVRVRPGIRFADDPAFGGQPRELVAQDYVFSFLRAADPALRSELWSFVETFKIEGLAERRRHHLDTRSPFDYDTPLPGLRALDRYTLQFRLADPQPRFLQALAASDVLGAVAREVVERYRDQVGEHPVGTGPFVLKQWRRSSLIVLERNPGYRERFFDEQPAADDAEGQAIAAQMAGRRIPMVDEVRISIIQEEQPRWLSFLNGQLDMAAGKYGPVPNSFTTQAMPGGHLAPNLAKRGIQGRQIVNADVGFFYFNMEDPVVGGYTAEKVALRRAIALAWDSVREIQVIRHGQGVPAQSNVVPFTTGYDPHFKSELSDHDPARANALLDLYGYKDVDGDGWRELPDGQPLEIVRATLPDQIYRQFDELWRKGLEGIGIRTRFDTAQWPEQLKKARAGKLQVWSLGSSAAAPDGQGALNRLHGPQSGSQNLARFRLPEMDALFDRISQLPDGPEREALFLQTKKLATAYAPYVPTVHRTSIDLWYPWVQGYRRSIFWNEWWHLVDIDPALRPPTA